MSELLLLALSAIVSLSASFAAAPSVIRYLARIGVVAEDLNKPEKPVIPRSAGLIATIGLFFGVLSFAAVKAIAYEDFSQSLDLFAGLLSIMLIAFVGFVDDLAIRRKTLQTGESYYQGLSQLQKTLLVLPGVLPLIAVSAGDTSMSLPFIGTVDFGLAYLLVILPIGVYGAANMVNMLGGFNGLEAGTGIVYLGMLLAFALAHPAETTTSATVILAAAVSSLLAVLYFNKFPAKIMAGDSLTYFLGATLAVVAILGNMQTAAVLISLPFFVEFALKARSKFKAQTYGNPSAEGKISSKYGREVYSIPHFLTRTGKFTEPQIVNAMVLLFLAWSLVIWLL